MGPAVAQGTTDSSIDLEIYSLFKGKFQERNPCRLALSEQRTGPRARRGSDAAPVGKLCPWSSALENNRKAVLRPVAPVADWKACDEGPQKAQNSRSALVNREKGKARCGGLMRDSARLPWQVGTPPRFDRAFLDSGEPTPTGLEKRQRPGRNYVIRQLGTKETEGTNVRRPKRTR
ncbi:uncharacterized protein SPSK_01991 [Sporothrix schenckii 1099-18]|uniref:Uncharacterized protein n=1 Tax=Sporothrix schenckii 1099-18 TaxID=1397361 RepID=A0A0F2MDV4_SPOSC|nr:uncharacterized protein SPSK_01991 [Sporothrix schenckii 1099-18]KJR87010.1 hypothetical protein SPSK_01991 [Sporothrix schenckii 1099-18]